jgi:phosphatidylglycerophosphate synthase
MPQRSAAQPAIAGQITGQSPLRVWSLPSAERLRRQLRRAGATAPVESAQRVVLLRADWVYDEPLVRGLVRQEFPCSLWTDGVCVAVVTTPSQSGEAAALLAAGQAPAALPHLAPEQIANAFSATLLKRESPLLLPLTADRLEALEHRVFSASYKGVSDFVTLYLWPRPAQLVTGVCAQLGITPNMVTSASFVLVLLAMWSFWHGHYGWGLVAAWAMTFLDTVDGKLARVTLSSSRFGDVFDHSIDLVHPPFWWWAWVVGLPAGLALPPHSVALTVIITGYILQRLEEGAFQLWFKINPHVWQRFDSRMRLITARRNPNLAILTLAALAGRPDLGIDMVAVWVAICFVIHGVRIVQAAIARRSGTLKSWLS